MCGRFILTSPLEELAAHFGVDPPSCAWPPRYNIAPTQRVPVIVEGKGGRRFLSSFRWGLIPGWAKDPRIGNRLINARAETLGEKPSFRSAFRSRRCLIPSNGFYEWKGRGKEKVPFLIRPRSDEPFAFAGLWERWRAPARAGSGEEILSFVIVTTEANEAIAPIHPRMPLILPKQAYKTWLDPEQRDPARLSPLLVAFPAEELAFHRVSTLVNRPGNDSPACIEPIHGLWQGEAL